MTMVILCVEDDADLREVLVEELTDAGYDVDQAAHGAQALVCLQQRRPDLVLCDIMMPVMDGYALLSHVRAHRTDLSDVPFVFLSAQDGVHQIVRGKHAGADDYLVKPIDFDLMLATIEARLRQVRQVGNLVRDQMQGLSWAQRFKRMLNLISYGIVLLDREAKVLFANEAAQAFVLERVGCALDLFPDREWHSHAQGVLQSAIAASRAGAEYVDYLSLTRSPDERDILVTVCALDGATAMPQDPIIALFLSDGSRSEPAPVKALGALFGLTPTEAHVAWAFVQGLRPDDIARAFSISSATVAFHKRNIFQKTNTNRQADLIALLLTLPTTSEVAD